MSSAAGPLLSTPSNPTLSTASVASNASALSRHNLPQAHGAPGGGGAPPGMGPTGGYSMASSYGLQQQPPRSILNDSEFPSLRGAPSPSSFSQATTSLYGATHHGYGKDVLGISSGLSQHRAPYANLMRTGSGGQDGMGSSGGEFQMQHEDFPALPGAAGSNSQPQSAAGTSSSTSGPQAPSGGLHEHSSVAAAVVGAIGGAGTGGPSSSDQGFSDRGIQTHPDGQVTNIPAGMLADQYGMAGLVTYLRAVDNPAIVALALGHDLTTLGLNLNLSERHLYTTFGGPWADYPCRTQDLDAKVPEEYLTNASIRDKLPNIKLNKLSEDVLFYLFYNYPGEVYQMAAACELYSRDWRFHKGDGVWLTRSQYGGVKEQTSTYEKGSYNVFDPQQWRKIPKDMVLEYQKLEERPKLPATMQQMPTPASTLLLSGIASQLGAGLLNPQQQAGSGASAGPPQPKNTAAPTPQ